MLQNRLKKIVEREILQNRLKQNGVKEIQLKIPNKKEKRESKVTRPIEIVLEFSSRQLMKDLITFALHVIDAYIEEQPKLKFTK